MKHDCLPGQINLPFEGWASATDDYQRYSHGGVAKGPKIVFGGVLTDEEASRVVLPRFAPPYDPFRHEAPDECKWIDSPYSRYLNDAFLRGHKCTGGTRTCTPAQSIGEERRGKWITYASAPPLITTEDVSSVCPRHLGALKGRNWKTGAYGEEA